MTETIGAVTMRRMKSGPVQLKDWMRRRGFNKTETARFFGWQLSFLSYVVNGRRSVGLANAILIERKTGIPVEAWLLTELDKSPEAVPAGDAKPQLD